MRAGQMFHDEYRSGLACSPEQSSAAPASWRAIIALHVHLPTQCCEAPVHAGATTPAHKDGAGARWHNHRPMSQQRVGHAVASCTSVTGMHILASNAGRLPRSSYTGDFWHVVAANFDALGNAGRRRRRSNSGCAQPLSACPLAAGAMTPRSSTPPRSRGLLTPNTLACASSVCASCFVLGLACIGIAVAVGLDVYVYASRCATRRGSRSPRHTSRSPSS